MTRAMSLVTHISVSLHFHPGLLYKDISVSSFYYFHPTRPNHPGVLYTHISVSLHFHPEVLYTDISASSFYYFIQPVPIILEYHIQIYPPHPGVPYTDISASSSNPCQSSIKSRGWIFCL